jgi:hypothetical protein
LDGKRDDYQNSISIQTSSGIDIVEGITQTPKDRAISA